MTSRLTIRDLAAAEADTLGQLLVRVYSGLDGFPTPAQQPGYYDMLLNIGLFTQKSETRVLVALTREGTLAGGVVYFGDMASYGAGGPATQARNASGIRLLGVEPSLRNMGVGKALTRACIDLARERGHGQVILHTTRPMKVAWGLYERLGFRRSDDLDFDQQGLQVFGFRLILPGA
ncbi:MAG: N-acetyltransferase [Xanthomonadaceae bacterium]|nr:N-acetyltransferase [Xanthomonadaceae bacterium]